MSPGFLFQNVYFRELVDKLELTQEKPVLNFVQLLLNDLPYNVRSGQEDVNSHYNFLSLQSMTDAVASGKWE